MPAYLASGNKGGCRTLTLNSLLHLPEVVVNTGHGLSRAFLVAAMAAIGIKTHLKDILSVVWKPVALMLLETVFLAVLVYMLILQR